MPWLLVRTNGWALANQLETWLSGPHCVWKYWKKLGGGGGLGGEVGEGGVVLHQYTHHLPELLWGEPRLSLTDKDNVTDGG